MRRLAAGGADALGQALPVSVFRRLGGEAFVFGWRRSRPFGVAEDMFEVEGRSGLIGRRLGRQRMLIRESVLRHLALRTRKVANRKEWQPFRLSRPALVCFHEFGELKSVGHNIADSLASGIGMMIGVYEWMSLEKRKPARKDSSRWISSRVRPRLESPVAPWRKRYGSTHWRFRVSASPVNASDFRELKARFSGTGFSRRFVVTVEDQSGRKSEDEYFVSLGRGRKSWIVWGVFGRSEMSVSLLVFGRLATCMAQS
jgi:hypothetical protein